MDSRKKIALFYSYDENWIGGSYYIQTLVASLKIIDDKKKPHLIIICNHDAEYNQIKSIGYPYLEYWNIRRCRLDGNLTIFNRILNKMTRIFFNKNIIKKPGKLNYPSIVDLVFPTPPNLIGFVDAKMNLFWIPDFQELHFPEFFNKKELKKRKSLSKSIADMNASIVFSSWDAQKDFMALYPKNKCKKYILSFAVTHPDISNINSSDILTKFRINLPYFFCSNQFWVHKNHFTLIRAFEEFLQTNPHAKVLLVFTGKEEDFRDPLYSLSLKEYVLKNNLSKNILFLGFIDRKEQLIIMKNSMAVIQPSLFEGWSTVIEDAKLQNKVIIASDLAVHLAQLKDYPTYKVFEQKNSHDLCKKLKTTFLSSTTEISKYNYYTDLQTFANNFMNIIEET